MDGTLIDSAPVVTRRYRETFLHFGIEVPSEQELHALVGPSAAMTMEKYLGADLVQEGIAHYRSVAEREGIDELNCFDGIPELLENLYARNLKLAVATSKPEIEAVKILKNLDLDHFFGVVSGASDANNVHTKTDVMKQALLRLDVPQLSQSIMIGDRIFDVDGSIDCGIDCVFVTWGGADLSEALNANYVAHTPTQLSEILI